MTDLPGGILDREMHKFRQRGTDKTKTSISTTHHASGTLEQHELTATDASTEVLAGNHIEDILISVQKQTGSNTLRVSFDGGTNFLTVKQNGTLSSSDLPKDQLSIYVKSSSGSINYEVMLYRES